MDGTYKKVLVKRGVHCDVQRVLRTPAELRQYKINNVIEQERLDGVAAQMKEQFGADFTFLIEENQHEGILGFVSVRSKNERVPRYNEKYLTSGCRTPSSFAKKFPWVEYFTPEYRQWVEGISSFLDKMSEGQEVIYYYIY